MGVQYLTQDNFSLQDGGQKMVCDAEGIVLVMFKTENCSHCKQFFPIFTRISHRETRIVFACLNVENNRNIVQMSRGTKKPISAVPYFILYVNGKPYAKYKGARTEESLNGFIEKMTSNMGLSDQSVSSGTASSFMNPGSAKTGNSISFSGAPLEKERAPPTIANPTIHFPHNAPYLAYVKNGKFA